MRDDKPYKQKNPNPIPIESEWVKQIQDGDGAAFEKLFRMYCQPLINFARRYVGDIATAENLVQDVFLKIWENRAQLNPDLKIKTYLYTAVKNQAFKHLRHLNVERDSAVSQDIAIVENRDADDELAEKELSEAIDQAIAQLPEKCRIVFSMNRFDQLTYSEIAKVQGISIKTVETQMGRALKFLRKRLALFLTVSQL